MSNSLRETQVTTLVTPMRQTRGIKKGILTLTVCGELEQVPTLRGRRDSLYAPVVEASSHEFSLPPSYQWQKDGGLVLQ